MGQSTDGIIFYGYCWDDEESAETYNRLADKHDTYEAAGPVAVGSHCSCDFPMLFVCVKQTYLCARRGSPRALPVETILAMANVPLMDDWRRQLKAFCDENEVDLSEAKGPDWFLVSNWC